MNNRAYNFVVVLITVLILFTITACGSSGGRSGGDSSNENYNEGCLHIPIISNLQYAPNAVEVNDGDGSVILSGTLDFTDGGGDVSSLRITVMDSNSNQVSDNTTPVTGMDGLPTATIAIQAIIDTTVVGDYSFEITLIDSHECTSNKLIGLFSVSTPAPATATVTISPSESTVTNGSSTPTWSTQYFTIVVKDAKGIPLSDVALNISYSWAIPNAYGAVQLYDGNTTVDSPMEATTDENGVYHLRFDFQSGGGLEYSGPLEVKSGSLFGSADFSVETGGS